MESCIKLVSGLLSITKTWIANAHVPLSGNNKVHRDAFQFHLSAAKYCVHRLSAVLGLTLPQVWRTPSVCLWKVFSSWKPSLPMMASPVDSSWLPPLPPQPPRWDLYPGSPPRPWGRYGGRIRSHQLRRGKQSPTSLCPLRHTLLRPGDLSNLST